MSQTKRIFANEVTVGQVILFPNRESQKVESITRDDIDPDRIVFVGPITTHSSFADEVQTRAGESWEFWDEKVTVIL